MPNYNTQREYSVQEQRALSQVCSALEDMPVTPDNAREVHQSVVRRLISIGASVRMEYPMSYMGKTRPRRGRIDVYAKLGKTVMAIELDARRPRQMSLAKLRNFNGLRICGLRGVAGLCPDEIDAVVSIPVIMQP